MPERKLDAQKRQRIKVEEQMLHPCLIIKAAEGVLCTIFSFLNVREHFNLARTCVKMEKISVQWQASPVAIDLELMQTSAAALLSKEVQAKIIRHLMAFRPLKLVVPFHLNSELQKEQSDIKRMTSLRELTLQSNPIGAPNQIVPGIEWLSHLTRLTKLTIPDRNLLLTTPLPTSLTHLEFLEVTGEGFTYFDSTPLFSSTHLQSLCAVQTIQVLKLPNYYCQLIMLDIGRVLPQLRELSLGYFNVRGRTRINFSGLQTCQHLETLTVGFDSTESICEWESLAVVASLRRLTISIYQSKNPPNLFAGLSQVTQLTHLQLVPHPGHIRVDISFSLDDLTTTKSDSSTIERGIERGLIRLSSLLISTELVSSNLSHLSALSTLQELMIPSDCGFVQLPRLRILHVAKGKTGIIAGYEDQLTTIVYKDAQGYLDKEITNLLDLLLKMKKLTTLKLHPSCSVVQQQYTSAVSDTMSVFQYFRLHLPATVQIEIDHSMRNSI